MTSINGRYIKKIFNYKTFSKNNAQHIHFLKEMSAYRQRTKIMTDVLSFIGVNIMQFASTDK